MSYTYGTTGRSAMANLAENEPHELLLKLGGALAVLLSIVPFGIRWYQGIPSTQLTAAVMTAVLGVILGAALWASAAITRKSLMNGAIVAGVVSLVLLIFGGLTVRVGGIAGLLGAIIAAASPYLPWSRE